MMWYDSQQSTITFEEELVLTVFCNFNFGNFPFDIHKCNLTFIEVYEKDPNVRFEKITINEDFETTKMMPGPFQFHLEPLMPFKKELENISSPASGFQITMTRKPVDLRITVYFFPTGAYSFISTISCFLGCS